VTPAGDLDERIREKCKELLALIRETDGGRTLAGLSVRFENSLVICTLDPLLTKLVERSADVASDLYLLCLRALAQAEEEEEEEEKKEQLPAARVH
jgi:hypothetical protein